MTEAEDIRTWTKSIWPKEHAPFFELHELHDTEMDEMPAIWGSILIKSTTAPATLGKGWTVESGMLSFVVFHRGPLDYGKLSRALRDAYSEKESPGKSILISELIGPLDIGTKVIEAPDWKQFAMLAPYARAEERD
jgi:hypothetical protein